MRRTPTCVPLASLSLIVIGTLFFTGALWADGPNPPEGFRSLFDGKSLEGWHGNNPHQTAKASEEEREQAIAAHGQISAGHRPPDVRKASVLLRGFPTIAGRNCGQASRDASARFIARGQPGH